jgi:hypothetical protein
LLSASAGVMKAVRVDVAPTWIVAFVLSSEMSVTGTGSFEQDVIRMIKPVRSPINCFDLLRILFMFDCF